MAGSTPASGTTVFDRFAPGTMLGRYELLATIGEGGMARVVLARQRGPGGFEKAVVIKVIHPRVQSEQHMVGMLLDEARVAAQINHPNVVQTYELGEAHGNFYIVMEYLAGESLARVLKTAALGASIDVNVAAHIVADAADGLHAAHELCDLAGRNLGVVHRDVSLGNIVVLYSGQVKVVDFGIAKAHDRVSSTTQEGQLKGKYAYMSPEQIQNQPMDRRSDVFALGVVLWEALTLRKLFQCDNVAATLMNILSPERIAPSQYRPDVPAALDAIALKALAMDPRDRFQTCDEMKHAIEDAIWQSRCTSTQVGAYMSAVFADRIEQRRKLLAAAATDAAEQTYHASLGFALDDHSNSELRVPARVGAVSLPKIEPPRRRRGGARTWVGAAVLALGVVGGVAGGYALVKKAGAQTSRPATSENAPAATAPPAPPVVQHPTDVTVARDSSKPMGNPTSSPSTAQQNAQVAAGQTTASDVHEGATAPASSSPMLSEVTPTQEPPKPNASTSANDGDRSVSDRRSNTSKPSRDPRESVKDLYKKGTELYFAGDFVGAESVFKRVLAANSRYAPAHRSLGLVYQRQGANGKAVASLKRYLALDPHAPDVAAIEKRIEQLGGEP